MIPKTKKDLKAKLLELDQAKEKIIQLRKQEIFKMIDKISCLDLDDELILSSLLVAKEISDSKDNLPEELNAIKKYFDNTLLTHFPKRKKTG